MRKSHLIVLSAILILTISNAVMADVQPAISSTPAGVVNINTADSSQLAMLPRVGVKAAQRIIDYRKEHGAFNKPSDLMQVKGFGEKSFERLSAWVTVEGKTTLAAKAHTHSTRARKPSKKSSSPSPAAR